jgi:hypothetical protein
MNKELLWIIFLTTIFCLISYLCVYKSLKIYDDPILTKVREDLTKVYPNFPNLGVSLFAANDSFTENKKKIFLCVKKPNKDYYKYNTIMYIALHELAHVLTKKYDIDTHGEEFHKSFNELIKRAKEVGVYDETNELDYDYCGTE